MIKILLAFALHAPADTVRPAYYTTSRPHPHCDTTFQGKDTILWCPYSKEQAKRFTAADTALWKAQHPGKKP